MGRGGGTGADGQNRVSFDRLSTVTSLPMCRCTVVEKLICSVGKLIKVKMKQIKFQYREKAKSYKVVTIGIIRIL